MVNFPAQTEASRQYGPVADLFFEMAEDLFDNGKINITPLDKAFMIKSAEYKPSDNLLNGTEEANR